MANSGRTLIFTESQLIRVANLGAAAGIPGGRPWDAMVGPIGTMCPWNPWGHMGPCGLGPWGPWALGHPWALGALWTWGPWATPARHTWECPRDCFGKVPLEGFHDGAPLWCPTFFVIVLRLKKVGHQSGAPPFCNHGAPP